MPLRSLQNVRMTFLYIFFHVNFGALWSLENCVVSCRWTTEGSRLHQSVSMQLKECLLAQYACVTCLCISTSNAYLHFPFQHMLAQTHSHSSHRGFLTAQPRQWFHLTAVLRPTPSHHVSYQWAVIMCEILSKLFHR